MLATKVIRTVGRNQMLATEVIVWTVGRNQYACNKGDMDSWKKPNACNKGDSMNSWKKPICLQQRSHLILKTSVAFLCQYIVSIPFNSACDMRCHTMCIIYTSFTMQRSMFSYARRGYITVHVFCKQQCFCLVNNWQHEINCTCYCLLLTNPHNLWYLRWTSPSEATETSFTVP